MINPAITQYKESYDSRKREPIVFPAKIPAVLIQGAEGIAVGMATHILPHNFGEVLEALKARLKGKKNTLYPDFASGGVADVSEYADGNGKILVRAKLDLSDPKRIVIRELPYGHTCDSLIATIESAARQNKIKIQSIEDYTGENVEIEIKLARGVYSEETVDALYAFTGCESSVSVNFLVIKEGKPTIMTVNQVIVYHSQRLTEILTQELKLEESQLKDKLHARTLEQIFVEERIYKRIESMKTRETVIKAVMDGFKLFASQIKREVTTEDVERLLKIPIRRISLYDINQARKEMEEIKKRLKEIRQHLGSIVKYAVFFLDEVLKKYGRLYPRRTEIISFEKVNVREAAMRNLKLKYDKGTGYLGYEAGGNVLLDVSQYDRILVIRKTGAYSVMNVPDKLFVDKGMWYCGFMDAETAEDKVFTVVFRDNTTGFPYIKRCKIEQFILNKGYSLVPENATVLRVTTEQQGKVELEYKPRPRLKVLKEMFKIRDYLIKGAKTAGVRLAHKEVKSARVFSAQGVENGEDDGK